MINVAGPAFPQCTACSPRIVREFEKQGFPMLLKVFNDPKYLEQVTGLSELHKQVEDKMKAFDDGDGDDF
jgi:ubiquitin-like modifier-activating enzyme ATG7